MRGETPPGREGALCAFGGEDSTVPVFRRTSRRKRSGKRASPRPSREMVVPRAARDPVRGSWLDRMPPHRKILVSLGSPALSHKGRGKRASCNARIKPRAAMLESNTELPREIVEAFGGEIHRHGGAALSGALPIFVGARHVRGLQAAARGRGEVAAVGGDHHAFLRREIEGLRRGEIDAGLGVVVAGG